MPFRRALPAGLIVIALVSPGTGRPASELTTESSQRRPAAQLPMRDLGTVRRRAYWGAFMNGDPTYIHYYGGTWENAPWDARTWRTFESNAGKRVSVVHWGMAPPWQRPFSDYRSTFELVRKEGALNAVSMSTGSVRLRGIARGRYDASLRKWLRSAAAWGYPFFLRLNAEMNGPWEPYAPGRNGNTATDFIRMWRHFHNLAERAGATNITWVWCPNVDPWKMFTPYGRLYPGRAYVDWTCLDGYNQSGTQTFPWLFRSSYARLLKLAPRKPVMIAETASVEGGIGKAAWITEALANQLPNLFPRVKAILWFNWRIYERGTWWEWPIESSASSQTAFRNAIASPHYVPGGSFRNLRRGSKIKAP